MLLAVSRPNGPNRRPPGQPVAVGSPNGPDRRPPGQPVAGLRCRVVDSTQIVSMVLEDACGFRLLSSAAGLRTQTDQPPHRGPRHARCLVRGPNGPAVGSRTQTDQPFHRGTKRAGCLVKGAGGPAVGSRTQMGVISSKRDRSAQCHHQSRRCAIESGRHHSHVRQCATLLEKAGDNLRSPEEWEET